jgi:two-component system nitrogen regulation response regulator GlnG
VTTSVEREGTLAKMGVERQLPREDSVRGLLIGSSRATAELVANVVRAADSDRPVVVRGEPGSGRERIARIIHGLSPRAAQPFITLCETLPGELGTLRRLRSAAATDAPAVLYVKGCDRPLQWVLGGESEAGATWEFGGGPASAVEGSLRWMAAAPLTDDQCFVELGDAPALADDSGTGGAGWIELVVPPLRARTEDIGALTHHFLHQAAGPLRIAPPGLHDRALARLVGYRWPGNVAELRDAVQAAVLRMHRRGASVVTSDDFDGLLADVGVAERLRALSFEELVRIKVGEYLSQLRGYAVESLYTHVMQRVERPLLETVMESTGGNQLRAADLLGINRNTLRKKLAELCAGRQTEAPALPPRGGRRVARGARPPRKTGSAPLAASRPPSVGG